MDQFGTLLASSENVSDLSGGNVCSPEQDSTETKRPALYEKTWGVCAFECVLLYVLQ